MRFVMDRHGIVGVYCPHSILPATEPGPPALLSLEILRRDGTWGGAGEYTGERYTIYRAWERIKRNPEAWEQGDGVFRFRLRAGRRGAWHEAEMQIEDA